MTALDIGPTTRDGLLRFALRLDAGVTGAVGLAGVGGASALDGVLGIPAGWLVGLGAFCVGWAMALFWLAARPRVPVGPAWTVLAINLLWLVDSVAVVALDLFPLTAPGTALVIVQALGVVVFAELQYIGVRRIRTLA